MTKFRLLVANAGLAGLFLVGFLTAPLLAAEVEHLTLDVNVGGSELVEIKQPSRKMKILISNEEIIGARPLRANLINVYNLGKKVGYSRVTVYDEAQSEVRAVIDVNVSLDVTPLKQKLSQLFPNEKVEVYSSESGIVLSGTVSGPEIMEQVLRLSKTFLPPKAEGKGASEGTGKSGDGVTNLMTVGGIQQVLLEVKFAEVNRTSSKNWQAALGVTGLGSSFSGAAGVNRLSEGLSGGAIPSLVDEAGSLLLNFAGNPANIFLNIDDFTAALNFLESEGMARILAEPKLITQSGKEASFLAGGEFPIPVPQDNNTVTIEYKEFGVALRFTPVVMSDGKISLRVAPSVSDIASSSTIPSGIVGADFIVPNLTTRKLETTVQLYDGQTLALAGLLQDSLRESVSKVPGLGDLPIIGALFRSTSYLQDKTDLLIAVTPHLVKANKEGTLRFPGENVNPPNRFEFYLEGRLEGRRSPNEASTLSRHSFAPAAAPGVSQGGLEGVFGQESISVE
jgi:pilus assembly protein CpaC